MIKVRLECQRLLEDNRNLRDQLNDLKAYTHPKKTTSSLTSKRSSLSSSMNDLRMDFGTSTFSTNLGLSYVLNERNIYGGSTLSLGGSTLSLDKVSDLSRTGSMSG